MKLLKRDAMKLKNKQSSSAVQEAECLEEGHLFLCVESSSKVADWIYVLHL